MPTWGSHEPLKGCVPMEKSITVEGILALKSFLLQIS